MIQRIQSVYLLLGALCLASLGFMDSIWQSRASESLAWFVPGVAAVGALTALVAVVAIFLYRDRPRQLKTVVAVQVMTLGFLVILYGGFFLAGDFEMLTAGGGDILALFALLLPIVAYVLFYLARRSIQRDIDLVKSMDRLR